MSYLEKDVKEAYEIIVNILNKEYKKELTELSMVKGGKFIVDEDPIEGGFEIGFVWYNNFGVPKYDSDRKKDEVIRETVLPATEKVREKVDRLKESLGASNLPIYAFHEFSREDYVNVVASALDR